MTDKVVAKFRCDRIESPTAGSPIVHSEHYNREIPADAPYIRVWFDAVTNNSEENKSWSKWTPSGQLTMHITNPACYDKFVPGSEYYLTIEKI